MRELGLPVALKRPVGLPPLCYLPDRYPGLIPEVLGLGYVLLAVEVRPGVAAQGRERSLPGVRVSVGNYHVAEHVLHRAQEGPR